MITGTEGVIFSCPKWTDVQISALNLDNFIGNAPDSILDRTTTPLPLKSWLHRLCLWNLLSACSWWQ